MIMIILLYFRFVPRALMEQQCKVFHLFNYIHAGIYIRSRIIYIYTLHIHLICILEKVKNVCKKFVRNAKQ